MQKQTTPKTQATVIINTHSHIPTDKVPAKDVRVKEESERASA